LEETFQKVKGARLRPLLPTGRRKEDGEREGQGKKKGDAEINDQTASGI